MQKILVPTDFSNNAMKAALYAAEIARKTKAAIFLVHVIEPVEDRMRRPFPLHDKYLEETAAARTKELKIMQKAISGIYPDVKIETGIAKGSVVSSIVDFAETSGMDLIIMGTKGNSGLKEVFMGTVAAGTIGRTRLPVLIIPDEYVKEKLDGILFATNHFEENKDLLNKIVELAKLLSATIHVAVFIEKDKIDGDSIMYDAVQLDHYITYLNKTYPEVAFKGKLLEGCEFEEGIEKYDKENGIDIIAMITYPKGFISRLLKRSATKKMAFHSTIPVLAVLAK